MLKRVFLECTLGGKADCTLEKIFSRRNLINGMFLYIALHFKGKPRYFNEEDWGTVGKNGKAKIEDSIYKLMVEPWKVLMIQHVNLVVKSIYLASWSIPICYLCF